MKIYTRTGDAGETALFGGGRVSKDHPRTSAYGDVDELNSVIGVARATAPAELFDDLLEGIQRDLFAIGGRLATPRPERNERKSRVGPLMAPLRPPAHSICATLRPPRSAD